MFIVDVFRARRRALTVGFEGPGLAAPAPGLVDGLDHEDVLGAALQAVYRVVVLLDVGDNHPALQRVTQACAGWEEDEEEEVLQSGPQI